MSETLLQVENLRTYFHTFRGVVCLLYTSDAADEL